MRVQEGEDGVHEDVRVKYKTIAHRNTPIQISDLRCVHN